MSLNCVASFEFIFSLNYVAGKFQSCWTNLDMYHDNREHEAYINFLANKYPDRIEIFEIGNSFENRSLKVIKIGEKQRESPKHAIWMQAGIHAREWISPATVAHMIYQLVESISGEEKHVLANFDIYVLSIVNPDG